MPEGPDGKTIIIVKKVMGHGGAHGGAWKVAYADFVTAMMALFLVLWLVNSASVTTREAIASYFKRPGVFEKGSGTPLELGGGGILADTFAPPSEANSQVVASKKIYSLEEDETEETTKKKKSGGSGGDDDAAFERVASELHTSIQREQQAIQGFVGNVGIKVDQRGLHLEIMDTETASMFQVGSAQVLPEANGVLMRLARILVQLPNPIDIEGHTDATPFRPTIQANYDNWNLASDRANAARRALIQAGLKEWQIARVVGYADKRPKKPENPFDPSNRRISISMRHTDLAAKALAGVSMTESNPQAVPQGVPQGGQLSAPQTEPVPAVPSGPISSRSDEYLKELDKLLPQEGEMTDIEAKKRDEGKLRFEVETSLPEGTIIDESDSTDSSRPAWLEKDKIFGADNPFK